jgi:hypothetical protein
MNKNKTIFNKWKVKVKINIRIEVKKEQIEHKNNNINININHLNRNNNINSINHLKIKCILQKRFNIFHNNKMGLWIGLTQW